MILRYIAFTFLIMYLFSSLDTAYCMDYVPYESHTKTKTWEGTPLIAAAMKGHTEIVVLLCKKGGVDIHQKDSNGKTALDYALEKEDKKMEHAIRYHILPPKNCGSNNNNEES